MAEHGIAVKTGLRWTRKPGGIKSRDELIECIDELTRFLESDLRTIDGGDAVKDVSSSKHIIQRCCSSHVHRYIKAVLSFPSRFRKSSGLYGFIRSKGTNNS